MDFKQTIVDVLSRRITDETVDLQEAAEALLDGLRLRTEWSWQTSAGESGARMSSREQVESEITARGTCAVIYRLVGDWQIDE